MSFGWAVLAGIELKLKLMKYFFDTEFIEGSQPIKMFGIKTGMSKPTIDLISGFGLGEGGEFNHKSKIE